MLTILRSDYELGRLLACKGDKEGARSHLELVMSGMPFGILLRGMLFNVRQGKPLEVPPASRKVCPIASGRMVNF